MSPQATVYLAPPLTIKWQLCDQTCGVYSFKIE